MSQAAPSLPAIGPRPRNEQRLEPQQWILLIVLALEIITFSFTGRNFLSFGNAFEVARESAPLGLLALAMTPVIVTGGIDLSVGSLMGLTAVVFGKIWRVDLAGSELAFPVAVICALAIGFLGGWLNGLLITRINIPALIVTLGTYSLYRGIGEGITKGSEAYTNLPTWFLNFGSGWQIPILFLAAVFFYLLLHRSTLGRSLVAIGYSPQGAAHAGINVRAKVSTVYVLSGLCASIAAIIYVAFLGQAKSDAGTDFELSAITAVVLGGTSIFGGRGSIIGTVLGLFAIALLEDGLGLSDQRGEIAGILKGVLLLAAIGADWRSSAGTARQTISKPVGSNEELDMRNSQLAALSAVIVLAAIIVTAGNFMAIQSLKQPAGAAPAAAHQYTIAMMPKATGNAYFIAAKQGADEAAAELGVKLLWDGPVNSDASGQSKIVESWITRGVDAIAVSVEDRGALNNALRKAKAKGIKIITWDADADADARDFFVNQATPQGIGNTLMDDVAQTLGGSGSYAIITATLTSANQQEWIKYVKQQNAAKYPNIKLVEEPQPCDDQQSKAFDQAKTIMAAFPDVKCIMAVCTPGVPGAAEAVKQSGRSDVHVVGLGLPNENKQYVHLGITTDVVLWNTMDLGYLAVYAAVDDCKGDLKPGDTSFTAGRLGKLDISGDNILLGKPTSFTTKNIDNFNF